MQNISRDDFNQPQIMSGHRLNVVVMNYIGYTTHKRYQVIVMFRPWHMMIWSV